MISYEAVCYNKSALYVFLYITYILSTLLLLCLLLYLKERKAWVRTATVFLSTQPYRCHLHKPHPFPLCGLPHPHGTRVFAALCSLARVVLRVFLPACPYTIVAGEAGCYYWEPGKTEHSSVAHGEKHPLVESCLCKRAGSLWCLLDVLSSHPHKRAELRRRRRGLRTD